MRIAIVLVAAALAGCAARAPNDDARAVTVSVSGPVFPASRFDCGGEPPPPDPDKVGVKAGSAAARYEDGLKFWGRECRSKLRSVGNELDAAGQVIRGSLKP